MLTRAWSRMHRIHNATGMARSSLQSAPGGVSARVGAAERASRAAAASAARATRHTARAASAA